MKTIIFKYGLISAALLSGLMVVNFFLFKEEMLDLGTSQIVGYSSMVLAFLLVFFGIRSYREHVEGGSIGFGKAFQVGILITLIACAGYVIAWQILYYTFATDFLEQYTEQVIAEMQEDGESEEEIEAMKASMARFAELYENPLFNVAITFIEVFPIGLIMTLVSAGILRRKPAAGEEPNAALG